jgi:hypothetical protein
MTDKKDKAKTWTIFVQKIYAIPETAMRRQVLIERLIEMKPESVFDFLDQVTLGVAQRKPKFLSILDAVHEAILHGHQHGALYEILAEVYRLAREAGNDSISRMLMTINPARGPLEVKDIPTDQELGNLTLGERKFLARGHNRDNLDRLLYDPEPAVVRNILQNPQITEQSVIRLAARRPTRAEIQKEVHSSKWGERYRVRLALISNPYTPTDLSIKLLSFLLKKDLKTVMNDTNLHQLIRDQAKLLWEQK